MKVAFSSLPQSTELRPVTPVAISGIAEPVVALVDSGAMQNRFDAELADELGIDISQVKPEVVFIG